MNIISIYVCIYIYIYVSRPPECAHSAQHRRHFEGCVYKYERVCDTYVKISMCMCMYIYIYICISSRLSEWCRYCTSHLTSLREREKREREREREREFGCCESPHKLFRKREKDREIYMYTYINLCMYTYTI